MNNGGVIKEDYSKLVGRYVSEVIVKYWKRKSIFEPLSNLLPEYWKDTFLRAVKEVMFEKAPTQIKLEGKPSYIWQLKNMTDCPNEVDYIDWTAQKIIEKERSLRKMVWYKNQWGDPYPPRIPINFFVDAFVETNESFESFKSRCENKMAEYVQDQKLREELLLSVYHFGNIVKFRSNQDGQEQNRKQFAEKVNWLINQLKP